MSSALAALLLAVSLGVTLGAARTFARRLDVLGVALGLPEALVGLLTALAADGPEIASALVALAKGEHGVGVGVVLGSNAFNLAAMIGLSALLSGTVALRRGALAIEGTMGLLATLLAAGVLLGKIGPALGAVLLACGGVPYVTVLLRSRPHVPHSRSRAVPDGGVGRHTASHGEAGTHAESDGEAGTHAASHGGAGTHSHARTALWMSGDVVLIVAGSFGMVQAAGTLGGRLGVSGAIVGLLVLGPLTSIPNAMTGVRLGLAGRGSALVSETLNSNTINLAAGIMIPALLIDVSASSSSGRLGLAWLLGMTGFALLALARRGGAGRGAGAVLIALYAGFIALQLAAS
ncbi:MAG TPA: hypothetical protein VMU32_10020 [Solirubrobacteraceae bacterium]|nr:hypothetical protein [Solirubrobacteraceae bacterium]